jgi:creatinine amidohydrolase
LTGPAARSRNESADGKSAVTEVWAGRLAWSEVERRLAAGCPAILPVGAGAKEHGPHLPMNTDEVQAAFFAERLARRIDGLAWPVVGYGHYPAFRGFAGSIDLARSTFEAMLSDLIGGLIGTASRRIFVLNTGISTLAPVDAVLQALGEASRVVHLRLYDGPRFRDSLERALGHRDIGHAGESETSLMLTIAPKSVNLAEAPAELGGVAAVAAAHGQALVEAILADLEAQSGASAEP